MVWIIFKKQNKKVNKYDTGKLCTSIHDGLGIIFVCRDFDFLNETLSFLYAILLEIIGRTRYFIKHWDLNVDKSVSSLVGDKRF